MLWLCLYFPLLPLQVFTRSEQTERPTLASEQGLVVCTNTVAAKSGIRPGQSLTTAMALDGRLHVLSRDISKEVAALNQLSRWCYQFSPMVSLKSPHILLLEIEGSLRLFKGLGSLLKRITHGLEAQGFIGQRGLGYTPKAAELFARSALKQTPTDIKSSLLIQELREISIALLDIPGKQITLLQEMGLTTLGQVLDLPHAAIGKRFGVEFLRYLQQIMGKHPDPQLPISLEPRFHSELFYIEGIQNKQGLLFPIKRLLTELCDYLRTRQLDCQGFEWCFAEIKGKTRLLQLAFSQPQNSFSVFLELTRIKLESLPLGTAVHSVLLTSKTLIAANPAPFSLWDGLQYSSTQSPELLLDKLSARLGKDALHGIACRQEHIPELAWQPLPCTQTQPVSAPLPTVTKLRPLWLLPQPAPVQQRQEKLYWQGQLTLLRGPERIDSHWWQSPRIQRDYFVARHEQGGLYWLFRDLATRRWFVHGLFY